MKMTPVDMTELNIEESGPTVSEIVVVVFFSVLSCAFAAIMNTHHFSYLEGLGKKQGGSFLDALLFIPEIFLMIFAVILIVPHLRFCAKFSVPVLKPFFSLLLVAVVAVPVTVFCLAGPGYVAFSKGFAERVKKGFIINSEAREWLKTRVLSPKDGITPFSEWPQAVQDSLRGITASWENEKYWLLSFDGQACARFTMDNGTFSIERGLAIRLDGQALPAVVPEEYRIPLNGEIYIFTSNHD